ncbi:hypothetical protein HY993_02090 [Candidatus Micrarchaeota archaeon]|nr:hypothetical protein [Candidatus Micrarchaeota archaeon]
MDKPKIVSVVTKKISELPNTEDDEPHLNTSIVDEGQFAEKIPSLQETPQPAQQQPGSSLRPKIVSQLNAAPAQDFASEKIRAQHLSDITPIQGGAAGDPHDLAKKICEKKRQESSISFKVRTIFGSLLGKKQ